MEPFLCNMRNPHWDYTTADAGPQCEDINAYDVTNKWYKTDAWGRCFYDKVSDDDVTPGVVIGTLTKCDRPGAVSMVQCRRSWRSTETCEANEVPWGRETIALPIVRCEQKYSN